MYTLSCCVVSEESFRLLVCKCSLSLRRSWGKLKIGHTHLWASCLFTACGTASASPLSSCSVLFACLPPAEWLSLPLPLYFPTFSAPESGLVFLASSVLAWKAWNRTPLPLTTVHYTTGWETWTQGPSMLVKLSSSRQSWIHFIGIC